MFGFLGKENSADTARMDFDSAINQVVRNGGILPHAPTNDDLTGTTSAHFLGESYNLFSDFV